MNKTNKLSILFAAALMTLASTTALADPWPQFGGPTRNAQSAESGLCLECAVASAEARLDLQAEAPVHSRNSAQRLSHRT